MNGSATRKNVYDVAIVGGGAAGVGVALALQQAGIQNFVILERYTVGASFALWPSETRFITPSFPTNSIGMLDLNSIAIGVSPAFSLQVEHPTGEEYALHLRAIAQYFKVPVREQANITRIAKVDDLFQMETSDGPVQARNVIWAAGEFQYPSRKSFEGSRLCMHTATVPSYEELSGDEFIVIGGYESGIDAAYHLARRGKRVRVFDKGAPWRSEDSDPSTALSTYSLERMREDAFIERVSLHPNTPIASVARTDAGYTVTTVSGHSLQTAVPPLLASGFRGSHALVADWFEQRSDGFPLLNKDDGSTIVSGLYLCGPAVRHGNIIFCFIYKYRQRFAVVAKAIATSLGLPAEGLEEYRRWGMYLDDLSICGEDCVC